MKSVIRFGLGVFVALLGLSTLTSCSRNKKPEVYQAPALVPSSSVQAAPLAAPAQPAQRVASQTAPYSK